MKKLPSHTGQHSPGTFLGWRHGVRQNDAWHFVWPPWHAHVVQSSSIHVSFSDTFLPDGVTHPVINNNNNNKLVMISLHDTS